MRGEMAHGARLRLLHRFREARALSLYELLIDALPLQSLGDEAGRFGNWVLAQERLHVGDRGVVDQPQAAFQHSRGQRAPEALTNVVPVGADEFPRLRPVLTIA